MISLEKKIEDASRISQASFSKYEPLLENLRYDRRSAMYGFIIMNVRRITLLFMAMFLEGQQWLQLMLFILLGLFSLIYFVVS